MFVGTGGGRNDKQLWQKRLCENAQTETENITTTTTTTATLISNMY